MERRAVLHSSSRRATTFRHLPAQGQALAELGEVNNRLERANLSFATALVATLDARDRYTAGHSAAVAIYSRDIAARMGLAANEQNLVHLCGLVHDIGKVGLPAGLLEKAGALTLEERRLMEEHSAIGERILSKVEDYAEIARIVRHHHERVDGLGYPDGLDDEEIPLLAKIISVADAYDAMTSDRPYRDAMPAASLDCDLRRRSKANSTPLLSPHLRRFWLARMRSIARAGGMTSRWRLNRLASLLLQSQPVSPQSEKVRLRFLSALRVLEDVPYVHLCSRFGDPKGLGDLSVRQPCWTSASTSSSRAVKSEVEMTRRIALVSPTRSAVFGS